MKKRIWKKSSIFLCLLMVAMVFAVAVPMNMGAGSAMARSQVPFKGNFDGSTVPRVDPDLERFEVSGQASHLGRFTAVIEANIDDDLTWTGRIHPSGLPIMELLATATFTAANGDELNADLVLVGPFNPTPTVQNFPFFALSGTITGGTGPFDGATGSFSGSGGQTSVPGPDNDLVNGMFSGTISTVGSNK